MMTLSAAKRAKQIQNDLKILEQIKQDSFLERERTKRRQSKKFLANNNTYNNPQQGYTESDSNILDDRRQNLTSCSGQNLRHLTSNSSFESPLNRLILSPSSEDRVKSISRSRKGWDMPLQLPVIKESLTKMNQIQAEISNKIKEKQKLEKEIQEMKDQLRAQPIKSQEDSLNSISVRREMIKEKIQNDKLFTPRKISTIKKRRKNDQNLMRSQSSRYNNAQASPMSTVPIVRADTLCNQKTVKLAKYLEEQGVLKQKNVCKIDIMYIYCSQQVNDQAPKSKQDLINEKLMIQTKKWAQKRQKKQKHPHHHNHQVQEHFSDREEQISFRTPARKNSRKIQQNYNRLFSLSLSRNRNQNKKHFHYCHEPYATPHSKRNTYTPSNHGKKTPEIAQGVKMSWGLNSQIPQVYSGIDSRRQSAQAKKLHYNNVQKFKAPKIQYSPKTQINDPRLVMPKNIFQSAEYRRIMYTCASPIVASNFNYQAELRKSKDRFHFY